MANTRILTEAEKEAIYDAQRSGSAYVKPASDDDTLIEILIDLYGTGNEDDEPTPPADVKAWIDQHFEDEDTPLSDTERKVIGVLFPSVAADKPTMPPNPSPLLLAVADFIESYQPGDEANEADDRCDEPFDRAVDAAAELPRPLRDRAAALLQGFVAGVEAASAE